MTRENLTTLQGLDVETVAQAVEADAGRALPGLRESLAEAQAGLFATVHAAEQPALRKGGRSTPSNGNAAGSR